MGAVVIPLRPTRPPEHATPEQARAWLDLRIAAIKAKQASASPPKK